MALPTAAGGGKLTACGRVNQISVEQQVSDTGQNMATDADRDDWEAAIAEIRERLARFLKAVSDRPLSDDEKAWIRDQIATIDHLLDSYRKKFGAS
jgi:hypothetical protein